MFHTKSYHFDKQDLPLYLFTEQQNFGPVMTKLKAFVDDKLNIAKMTIFLFDRVENTERKGENAG